MTICSCGKPAHPCYGNGNLCEDCWSALQPDSETGGGIRRVRVPAVMRAALTPGQLSGFWDSVRFDDSRDEQPALQSPPTSPKNRFMR